MKKRFPLNSLLSLTSLACFCYGCSEKDVSPNEEDTKETSIYMNTITRLYEQHPDTMALYVYFYEEDFDFFGKIVPASTCHFDSPTYISITNYPNDDGDISLVDYEGNIVNETRLFFPREFQERGESVDNPENPQYILTPAGKFPTKYYIKVPENPGRFDFSVNLYQPDKKHTYKTLKHTYWLYFSNNEWDGTVQSPYDYSWP